MKLKLFIAALLLCGISQNAMAYTYAKCPSGNSSFTVECLQGQGSALWGINDNSGYYKKLNTCTMTTYYNGGFGVTKLPSNCKLS